MLVSMSELMKAVVYTRYGAPDVLTLREVRRPEPRDDEVRIAIRATTVTAACGMMRRGDTLMARLVLGVFRPRRRFRIMGTELCGVVERTGRHVTRFRVGERVFGFAGFRVGTNAEYVCLRESASLAPAPEGLTDVEAASLVDGPTTALHFLRRAGLRTGMRVVIVGASGSVGSAAVQLARHLGAHVTAVCSGRNAELVRSLGAHEVVDYTREDYSAGGTRYHIVFDAVGQTSYRSARRCLVDGGVYAVTVGSLAVYALDLWTRLFSRTRFLFTMSVEKTVALREVTELVGAGVLRPVIDRAYALAELPDAHRYVETARKRGNVVVTVEAV
jgi:NADPH:quinone reductase-like Zn-dependent oxidoreductase